MRTYTLSVFFHRYSFSVLDIALSNHTPYIKLKCSQMCVHIFVLLLFNVEFSLDLQIVEFVAISLSLYHISSFFFSSNFSLEMFVYESISLFAFQAKFHTDPWRKKKCNSFNAFSSLITFFQSNSSIHSIFSLIQS